MVTPLFGRPSPARATLDDRRQAAFAQLKAICVPLVALSRQASPTASTTTQTINSLNLYTQAVQSIPRTVFTPALANYAFFPLSALLQPRAPPPGAPSQTNLTPPAQPESLTRATFAALDALVRQWRRCADGRGMAERAWQELWMMVGLRLGGPLDPASAKGKEKDVGPTEDETRLVLLELLAELMRPVVLEVEDGSSDEDVLGDDIDWDGPGEPVDNRHRPSSSTSGEVPLPAPPPIPILFHTLTTLLDIAARPTSHATLQTTALDALALLISGYLVAHPTPKPSIVPQQTPEGPSPLIATALPGAASTLSRIAVSRAKLGADERAQPARVVVRALEVLALLVRETTGDEVTRRLRESNQTQGAATLEEIIGRFDGVNSLEADEQLAHAAEAAPPPMSGPTSPTPAWLKYSVQNLVVLLTQLSTLSTHHSSDVRLALVDLLDDVLSSCADSLALAENGQLAPLEGLLGLAADDWPSVAGPAKLALGRLLAGRAEFGRLVAQVVQTKLRALPRAILRGDEALVARSAHIVCAALALLPPASTPLHAIERWSNSLLHSLAFERVAGTGVSASGGLANAWITSGGADLSSSSDEDKWPILRMKHLKEHSSRCALEGLWAALGASAARAGQEREAVESFLGTATAGEALSPAALWVLDGLLRGMEDGEGLGKARKKLLRGVVKRVVELIDRVESAEGDPAESEDAADAPHTESTDLLSDQTEPTPEIERRHAISYTPSLDALAPVRSTASSGEADSQRVLILCLALRTLATASTLLESAFEPHLLTTLYPVLAHLGPTTHPLLRQHASLALAIISASTAYASPVNLLLSNADYLINSVTQRLSLARLDPNAPLVLTEMIRLVGKEVVPMVGDLVEDVFEALDDWHGYEVVSVGLWGVLDGLMKVLVEEEGPPSRREADAEEEVDPREKDWAAFEDWFTQRHDPPAEDDAPTDLPASNPQQPFENLTEPADPNEPKEPHEFPQEPDAPPTKSQALAAQILDKATYFLSHESTFLRARVVELIASAIPLLVLPNAENDPSSTKGRQADVLPIVHKAWPLILNRLRDPEPSVVLEAAGLVQSLAEGCGEFMSRRILDDVWPIFKILLESQRTAEKASALGGRFSTPHKLQLAILRTMRAVDTCVGLKEDILWEQAKLFRSFLEDERQDEVRGAAQGVYDALARVNGDLVWLALHQGAVE